MSKTIIMIICAMSLAPMTDSLASEFQSKGDFLHLNMGIYDPTKSEDVNKKAPIRIPLVYQDGTTLTFASPCAGCTLQLLDDDGEIIYETEVLEGATTALLPDESGIFELRLVYEGYYFYAEIML